MPRLINVCPHCDGTDFWVRSGSTSGNKRRLDGKRYRCTCGESFNEPVKREAKHPSGPTAETMLRRAVE